MVFFDCDQLTDWLAFFGSVKQVLPHWLTVCLSDQLYNQLTHYPPAYLTGKLAPLVCPLPACLLAARSSCRARAVAVAGNGNDTVVPSYQIDNPSFYASMCSCFHNGGCIWYSTTGTVGKRKRRCGTRNQDYQNLIILHREIHHVSISLSLALIENDFQNQLSQVALFLSRNR